MAPEPLMVTAEEREALQALIADHQAQQQMSQTRRTLLKAFGIAGLGAAGLSSSASAAAGTVGASGSRVDVFGEDIDTTTLTIGTGTQISDGSNLARLGGAGYAWGDLGSIGLQAAGTGNAFYPMHVPINDGETFYVDAWFLRLDDKTSDSNLEINLTDETLTNKVATESLSSDFVFTEDPASVSYSPGDGSTETVHVQIENNGSTDYTDSSNPSILYGWVGHTE